MTILNQIKQRLKSWHGDQQGAIALLVLASMIITFMLGLVMFDAGYMIEDKMEAQIAADTASWSQSAVEARAMNTIAFANVGKRITVGMISYYEALWISIAIIFAVVLVLTIACWIADILAWGALTSFCLILTEMTAELAWMIGQELPDLKELNSNLMKKGSGYFQKDVEAFTKYQNYMAEIGPWWSWGEGFMRGFRNGAITTSWPVPETSNPMGDKGSLGGFFSSMSSGVKDELPIVFAPDKDTASQNLCGRLWGSGSDAAPSASHGSGNSSVGALSSIASDNVMHALDYYLKTLLDTDGSNDDQVSITSAVTKYDRALFLVLMGVMAFGFTNAACEYNMKEKEGLLSKLKVLPAAFGENAWPWIIKDTTQGLANNVDWLLKTSNLTFAYRYGHDRGDGKYEAFQGDHDITKALQGVWSMSRSEISFQYYGNRPDLWHSSWVARMRPVALPGEWSGQNISNAYNDALPFMARGAVLELIAGNGLGFDAIADALRMKVATEAMKSNMDGVAK